MANSKVIDARTEDLRNLGHLASIFDENIILEDKTFYKDTYKTYVSNKLDRKTLERIREEFADPESRQVFYSFLYINGASTAAYEKINALMGGKNPRKEMEKVLKEKEGEGITALKLMKDKEDRYNLGKATYGPKYFDYLASTEIIDDTRIAARTVTEPKPAIREAPIAAPPVPMLEVRRSPIIDEISGRPSVPVMPLRKGAQTSIGWGTAVWQNSKNFLGMKAANKRIDLEVRLPYADSDNIKMENWSPSSDEQRFSFIKGGEDVSAIKFTNSRTGESVYVCSDKNVLYVADSQRKLIASFEKKGKDLVMVDGNAEKLSKSMLVGLKLRNTDGVTTVAEFSKEKERQGQSKLAINKE